MPNGNVYATQRMVVDPTQALEVKLTKWSSLSGQVRTATHQPAQLKVLVEPLDPGAPRPACQTSGILYPKPNGDFSCARLAAGRYHLSVENRLETEQDIELKPGEARTVTIDLAP